MESNPLQDGFFKFTSRLTKWFPRQGAALLDGAFFTILGSPALARYAQRRNQGILREILSFQRLLVIPDIHIGDAVLAQTAVSALRDFFPSAQIDYPVKKAVGKLVEGNPDISEVWPLFTGAQYPNSRDILSIQALSAEYDAVFNFCPFLTAGQFPKGQKVLHFVTRAPLFMRNERGGVQRNHISYQIFRFIHDLFSSRFSPARTRPFEGPAVFLSPEAIEEARTFFVERVPEERGPVVFLNTDTASSFTRIPFHFQETLLKGLAEKPCLIFLGEGHMDKGSGERLIAALPLRARARVILAPAILPLDAYAALTDFSDIFISGDTGPLHIAAARKVDKSGAYLFRNRTAVYGVFGATPPRLSGYDSRQPGYLESAQGSESRTYQSGSSCRNITCMHKMAKVCDAQGCFQSLDVDTILADVQDRLEELARNRLTKGHSHVSKGARRLERASGFARGRVGRSRGI